MPRGIYKRTHIIKASGENNNRWKGNGAGYHSKHQYLKRNFGNPQKCEQCSIKGKKEKGGRWNIHWAKKKGKSYTHNREDYLELCRSCHSKYDLTKKKVERLRKQLKSLTNKK